MFWLKIQIFDNLIALTGSNPQLDFQKSLQLFFSSIFLQNSFWFMFLIHLCMLEKMVLNIWAPWWIWTQYSPLLILAVEQRCPMSRKAFICESVRLGKRASGKACVCESVRQQKRASAKACVCESVHHWKGVLGVAKRPRESHSAKPAARKPIFLEKGKNLG